MTRVLLLAAGRGVRLGALTRNVPKCLLVLGGKSLLEHQVRNLRTAGLEDISVVTGHGAAQLRTAGIPAIHHPRHAETNMVASMLSAKAHFEGAKEAVLVQYTDILVEPRHLAALAAEPHAVSCLLDQRWQPYFRARGAGWRDDVELLQLGENRSVVCFGGHTRDLDAAQARFVGAVRFGAKLARRLPAHYASLGARGETLAMTDFLQSLIDAGVTVRFHGIRGGWLEIDTPRDYELAQAWVAQGEFPFLDGRAVLGTALTGDEA